MRKIIFSFLSDETFQGKVWLHKDSTICLVLAERLSTLIVVERWFILVQLQHKDRAGFMILHRNREFRQFSHLLILKMFALAMIFLFSTWKSFLLKTVFYIFPLMRGFRKSFMEWISFRFRKLVHFLFCSFKEMDEEGGGGINIGPLQCLMQEWIYWCIFDQQEFSLKYHETESEWLILPLGLRSEDSAGGSIDYCRKQRLCNVYYLHVLILTAFCSNLLSIISATITFFLFTFEYLCWMIIKTNTHLTALVLSLLLFFSSLSEDFCLGVTLGTMSGKGLLITSVLMIFGG